MSVESADGKFRTKTRGDEQRGLLENPENPENPGFSWALPRNLPYPAGGIGLTDPHLTRNIG